MVSAGDLSLIVYMQFHQKSIPISEIALLIKATVKGILIEPIGRFSKGSIIFFEGNENQSQLH